MKPVKCTSSYQQMLCAGEQFNKFFAGHFKTPASFKLIDLDFLEILLSAHIL